MIKKSLLILLIATISTFSYANNRASSILILADEVGPMEVLARFFESKDYTVKIADQQNAPEVWNDYSAVIQYIHSTMNDDIAQQQTEYTKNGGRLILLHHAIASARWQNPEFLKFVGIHLNPRDHETTPWRVIGNTTHTLVNLNPSHYITSNGVEYDKQIEYKPDGELHVTGKFNTIDFENTEVFLNQHFTDGYEKTVLFGFQCLDPESGETITQDRSGWLKPYGKGWVFYFQPGHLSADFENENYLQILLNCLRWER